jgi:hypothetical protein
VLGYSVSLVAADGSCKEVCAAGTSLVDLLNTNYKCGKCPPPLQPPGCPTQSPCKDFGNGLFGYSVSLVAADGSCKEACAAGTSLADLLKTDYKCGSCPPLSLPPGCPTETPCKDFGNGLLGYSISLVAADGSCKDVCAAGTSLTDLVHKTNYKCGQCTPPNLPSCPSINQCQEKGVGLMGYSVMKIAGNECAQYCATGADFTALLAEGFKCGKCPLPSCPGQESCKDFGGGLLGYSVNTVATDGSCTDACAAGASLTELLKTNYECGTCPLPLPPPGCPTQAPCKDFGNGLLGYSVSLVAADGRCKEVCAAGTSLTDLLKTNYKCGTCPPPGPV